MKKNLICIAVAAIIVLASYMYIFAVQKKQSNNLTAYIYIDGTLEKKIDLNNVSEPYTFVIGDPESDYNIVEVRQGSIGVTDASCPDKICVNTGFINSSLLPIVCLPNKLVIEIHSDSSNDISVDTVTQ